MRRRALLATAIFAVAVAIASTSIATAAHIRLTGEVDAHWRGLYDILVRPRGAQLDIEKTGGLVEPNFLGFTGQGGMTLGQLAAIRAIADVEVAAPVAFIGLLTSNTAAPTLRTNALPDKPTLYRATLSIATSDGVGERLVTRMEMRVLLGRASGPDSPPLVVSDVPSLDVGWSTGPDGTISVDLGTGAYLPPLSSPILAVDPTAEHALLGDTGAFLDPLIEATSMGPFSAASFDVSRLLRGYDLSLLVSRLRGTTNNPATPEMKQRPVYPILVSQRVYAPLKASLNIVQFGQPLTSLPEASDSLTAIEQAVTLAGPGTTQLGTTTIDLGARLRPLRINDLSIPWPGTSGESGGTEAKVATQFDARISTRPSYSNTFILAASSALQFVIAPRGAVGPGGDPEPQADDPRGSASGQEQSYRTWTTVSVPVAEGFVGTDPRDMPYALAPIGEYDLSTLDLPVDPLTYAPVGAYDPPDTTLIADPAGNRVSPQPMTPTLNPAGLIAVPPLAIADLSAAEGLRGAAPIDAVRVRVAGLADYRPESIAKVERVADQIAALGLDVDIVAGSSPQAVDVYVPQYDTSTNPPADLGWVEQHWTTLGAAQRVVQGVSDVDQALLLVTLFAVAVVVFGITAVDANVRARELAILAAFGWGRWRIVRWLLDEALIASLLVLAIGVTAQALAGRDPVGLAATLFAAALFPIAAVSAALLSRVRAEGSSTRGPDRLLSARPAGSVRSYALRAALARPWRSLVIVLGLAVAATAIAPAIAVVAAVGLRVGPTLLAQAVTAQLQPFQLAMLGLAGSGGVAIVVIALRRDLAERRGELEVLAASGWTPRVVRATLRWQRIVLFVPASMVAFIVTLGTGSAITGGTVPAIWVALLAALIVLSAIVWAGVGANPQRTPAR